MGRPGPVARLTFVALLVYVTLDLANPLMPGAVCFDPDESVEAVGRARPFDPASAAVSTAPAAPALDLAVDPRPGRRPTGPAVTLGPSPGVAPTARSAVARPAGPSTDDD